MPASPTIVGCDARTATADAVALAERLTPDGSRVILATAVPPRLRAPHVDEEARRAAEAALADAAGRLHGERRVERRILSGRSPAEALARLADDEGAGLVVVGSSREAVRGEARAGDVGRGLLKDARCPVALAPAGYATDAPATLERTGVAWTDTPEARAAVVVAERLPVPGTPTLYAVADLDMSRVLWGYEGVSYALGTFPEDLRAEARAELDDARAELGLPGRLGEGDPAAELVAVSRELDLLVVGSRSSGPLRRAALGSVSSRVVQGARCPVVVVPRGAGSTGAGATGRTPALVAAEE